MLGVFVEMGLLGFNRHTRRVWVRHTYVFAWRERWGCVCVCKTGVWVCSNGEHIERETGQDGGRNRACGRTDVCVCVCVCTALNMGGQGEIC